MEHWEICENPSGMVYERLIHILCDHSDHFQVVIIEGVQYKSSFLKSFMPDLERTYKTKNWPGTTTYGPSAAVYVFSVKESTPARLLKYTDSLYGWFGLQLPEDLAFIRNKFTWFYSTTHEEMSKFIVNEKGREMLTRIEGLKISKAQRHPLRLHLPERDTDQAAFDNP